MIKIKAVAYVLALGFILRLIAIDQSFWLDEATSGLVVRNYNFSEILSVFSPGDFHPPLYYLVLEAWSIVFGTSEVALRMVSVLFGVGTVYLLYLIGKELKDETLGVLAALLLASGPLHIYYSQEARMYVMGGFMVSLVVYFFIRTCGKKVKRWEWTGFWSALALLLLTDYLLALILPVLWIWALKNNKREGKKNKVWWRRFVRSQVIALAMFGVWLPIFREQLIAGMGVERAVPGWWKILGGFSLKNTMLLPVKALIGRVSFESNFLYGLVVLGIGSLFGILMRESLKRRGKYSLMWLWLWIPVGLGVGLSLVIPVLVYFRFLFVLPAMYFLVAAGLLEVKEKYFFPAIVAVLVVNLSMTTYFFRNDRFHRENWKGLVRHVNEESEGKIYRVVFVSNSQMEGYRYYDPDVKLYGPDGIEKGLSQIWLMRYVWDIFDPGDSIRKRVEELGYERKAEYNFNGVAVWKYENRD